MNAVGHELFDIFDVPVEYDGHSVSTIIYRDTAYEWNGLERGEFSIKLLREDSYRGAELLYLFTRLERMIQEG